MACPAAPTERLTWKGRGVGSVWAGVRGEQGLHLSSVGKKDPLTLFSLKPQLSVGLGGMQAKQRQESGMTIKPKVPFSAASQQLSCVIPKAIKWARH